MFKKLKKIAFVSAALLFAATGASAATCSSLTSAVSYSDFTSCTVTGKGKAGQDTFENVDPIVTALFGDEGISITESGSFSSGPDTGNEFFASRSSDGFEMDQSGVSGNNTFDFTALPTGTLFISLKQGNGFELFGLFGKSLPFSLTHSLGDSTSHISTFAGTGAPIPTPLPAGAWFLLAGIGGFAALRRRKKV